MKILILVILLCIPFSSQAVCSLTTNNLAFGVYTPANVTPLDLMGTISVSCDGVAGQTISYTLAFNTGNSGSFISRKMIYGSYALNYNLYLNAAYTSIWGDGNVGTVILTESYAAVAGGNVRNYTIYGRIPGSQIVPPGNYADTLIATLTY